MRYEVNAVMSRCWRRRPEKNKEAKLECEMPPLMCQLICGIVVAMPVATWLALASRGGWARDSLGYAGFAF